MSQGAVNWRKCDRCGEREEGVTFYAWGVIQAKPVNGAIDHRIGFRDPPRDHADLCPDCMRQLRIWWSRPPSPVTAGGRDN